MTVKELRAIAKVLRKLHEEFMAKYAPDGVFKLWVRPDMSKPWIHAKSSARRFGGEPEDYIEIHNLMDSSKGVIADSRHRALTHTAWFLSTILERIFGVTFLNSAQREVSVRDIGEQHILEDFGGRFIPSAQDYLENTEFKEWMINGKGQAPASFRFEKKYKEKKHERVERTERAYLDGQGGIPSEGREPV